MFKAKVKESEKTPFPKNISEIETVTGKVRGVGVFLFSKI